MRGSTNTYQKKCPLLSLSLFFFFSFLFLPFLASFLPSSSPSVSHAVPLPTSYWLTDWSWNSRTDWLSFGSFFFFCLLAFLFFSQVSFGFEGLERCEGLQRGARPTLGEKCLGRPRSFSLVLLSLSLFPLLSFLFFLQQVEVLHARWRHNWLRRETERQSQGREIPPIMKRLFVFFLNKYKSHS